MLVNLYPFIASSYPEWVKALVQIWPQQVILFLNVFFVGLPHLATYIFLYFSMSEPELGAGIDSGMAFNPFPSSILYKTRQDSNPQPLDRESANH